MGILRAVRSGFAGPPANDFYNRSKRARQLPPAELAVTDAALSGGGALAQRVGAQLREAPHVWRLISDDGSYELRVSTTKLVRGVPRAGWRSRPIPVRAQPGGRPLELELEVSSAGIVQIRGHALDGQPWPSRWVVGEDDLDAIRSRAPWMDLPTPAAIREQRAQAIEVIESWLGEPGILRGKRGIVAVEPPTAEETLVAFERTQAFTLPNGYRDLLLATNGFEIGAVVVLGTNDAYRLDMPGPDRLVIAPPNEDGALVLAPNGEVRFVDLEAETGDGRLRAPDLREWLRHEVRPRARG